MKRYQRQISLPEIGQEGQSKLGQAKVLVIGAGGLGCPVLMNLALAGVGTIGIVDGDVIDETNLHRQFLYTLEDCGKSKATTASKVITKSNPDCTIKTYNSFLTSKNTGEIIADYDILVDCTDAIDIRYLINDVAVAFGKPVVYASIHKFEGQVSVFNYQDGPTYRCLFPEPENKVEVPTCSTSGVVGVLPNMLGVLQATEVLKMVLGIGEVLSGKLLVYNALKMQTQTFGFSKNENQFNFGLERGNQIISGNVAEVVEISSDAFLEICNNNSAIIIDVREADEFPKFNQTTLSIPLSKFEDSLSNLDKTASYVLFCKSGMRSKKALHIMQQNQFENCSHLKGGIQSLIEIVEKI